MNKFNSAKKSLGSIQKKYARKKKELDKLNKRSGSTYTNDDIIRRSTLKDEIRQLGDKIDDICNDYDEMEYFDRVSDTLKEYYDMHDFKGVINSKDVLESHESQPVSESRQDLHKNDMLDKVKMMYGGSGKKKSKMKAKASKKRRSKAGKAGPSIVDYFTSGGKKDTNVEKPKNADTTEPSKPPTVPKQKKINKATLNHQYRMLVDHEYVEKERTFDDMYFCTPCNQERVLVPHEGMCVCKLCGSVEYVMVDCDRANNKDYMTDKPSYPYKRINHFNERLSQFQGKENTEIPEEVYDSIRKKLKQYRIYNYRKLTHKTIKDILKRLDYQTYYEHIPYIICKLNGMSPPNIGQKNEERLRSMFKEMQAPFQLYCPKERTNFLSYSYVLRKLCELIELDDVLQCFPFLKNPDKLRQQDRIWKKICGYCRWEFYPSV